MTKAKDRVIIDTNLWISFLLSNDYLKLDKLLRQQNITLIFSKNLLEEFIEVARRPKFKKYFSLSDLNDLLSEIHLKAEFIEVKSNVILCRDPKDDFLLSLAKDSNATHLVTGDNDLLELNKFEKTLILTISEYLLEK